MKSCVIYKSFGGKYKITSQSVATAGYLLAFPPVYLLESNCTDSELLSAIQQALQQSKEDVVTPSGNELKKIQRSLLAGLEEKSFTNLYKNSTSCEIRVTNGTVTLCPNKLFSESKPENGLVWVQEAKFIFEENGLEMSLLTQKVREVLNVRY